MKSDVVAHICDPTSLMTREALETKGPPDACVYGKAEVSTIPRGFPPHMCCGRHALHSHMTMHKQGTRLLTSGR